MLQTNCTLDQTTDHIRAVLLRVSRKRRDTFEGFILFLLKPCVVSHQLGNSWKQKHWLKLSKLFKRHVFLLVSFQYESTNQWSDQRRNNCQLVDLMSNISCHSVWNLIKVHSFKDNNTFEYRNKSTKVISSLTNEVIASYLYIRFIFIKSIFCTNVNIYWKFKDTTSTLWKFDVHTFDYFWHLTPNY